MKRRPSFAWLAALAVVPLLAACGPDFKGQSADDSSAGYLVPTRIGSGPTTAAPPTSRATTTAPPTTVGIQNTIEAPTVDPAPSNTARPAVQLGDLPGQVSANLSDPRVFVLGDSILASTGPCCTNQLQQVLGPLGWQITLDAQPDRTPAQALEVLQARRNEIGQVAVILIGNSAEPGGDVKLELQTMLSLLAGVPRVVLMTVSEVGEQAKAVNEVVREAGVREPNRVVLVDWDNVAKSTKNVLMKDHYHLTELGSEVLARAIATVLGPAPVGG
jgi:hypothetical protein